MKDDKVQITLSYAGKSVTFDNETLRKANEVLGKGGFLGREGDIGKPSMGSVLYCTSCGVELEDIHLQRPCRNGLSFCEVCCPCTPPCLPDSEDSAE